MKKKINWGSLAGAVVFMIVAVVLLIAHFFNDFSVRITITMIWCFVLSGINIYKSFSGDSILAELEETADERDIFVAMKSAQTALQILSYILWGGTSLSFVLYGLTKLEFFFVISLTLAAVAVILFFLLLAVNSYYERRN